MTTATNFPEASYGILQRTQCESALDEVAEQVRRIGYAVLHSGYSVAELQGISDEFDRTRERYIEAYGEQRLRTLNEYHAMRSPLTHGGEIFLRLALNENLLSVLKKLILGKFILNQQNGVINPPQETYNQGAWHRDLPYQHFVSTRPLAINALFCVDDFTCENGATIVLPASHKSEEFPSPGYVRRNAVQIEAKAGSFVLLDCMLFHTGGFNGSQAVRRAVNHVYNIPYFKQQIRIPNNMKELDLPGEAREVLGFNYLEPDSVSDYLSTREGRKY
ncbi:phytanoyl-CoA dioxygenase family protein [Cupriavidus sp. CV2]|uniref:phytanoyl-CoA dioxygenase family protein n=1 Tax=Cupriavidus ulmosensis TaxID=3065913 RepID=UPI00296B10EB|nr:phytanoyl-CoA dioxygenase family protein [Cupriavidus sp. CV2]MDW3681743.1 phytanoyl-CoA dioxygenase family protein [Cupriavidus sp. CV2]